MEIFVGLVFLGIMGLAAYKKFRNVSNGKIIVSKHHYSIKKVKEFMASAEKELLCN